MMDALTTPQTYIDSTLIHLFRLQLTEAQIQRVDSQLKSFDVNLSNSKNVFSSFCYFISSEQDDKSDEWTWDKLKVYFQLFPIWIELKQLCESIKQTNQFKYEPQTLADGLENSRQILEDELCYSDEEPLHEAYCDLGNNKQETKPSVDIDSDRDSVFSSPKDHKARMGVIEFGSNGVVRYSETVSESSEEEACLEINTEDEEYNAIVEQKPNTQIPAYVDLKDASTEVLSETKETDLKKTESCYSNSSSEAKPGFTKIDIKKLKSQFEHPETKSPEPNATKLKPKIFFGFSNKKPSTGSKNKQSITGSEINEKPNDPENKTKRNNSESRSIFGSWNKKRQAHVKGESNEVSTSNEINCKPVPQPRKVTTVNNPYQIPADISSIEAERSVEDTDPDVGLKQKELINENNDQTDAVIKLALTDINSNSVDVYDCIYGVGEVTDSSMGTQYLDDNQTNQQFTFDPTQLNADISGETYGEAENYSEEYMSI